MKQTSLATSVVTSIAVTVVLLVITASAATAAATTTNTSTDTENTMTSADGMSTNYITTTTTLVAATGIFIYLLYSKHRNNKEKYKYPPHPLPCRFFLGNALELPDSRKGYHVDVKLLEWAKELGPVFSFHVPIMGRTIVVADPDLVHFITVQRNYNKSWTYKPLIPLFGEHSMVMLKDGDEWLAHRKAFASGFAPAFLKGMVQTMHGKIMDRFLPKLDGQVVVTPNDGKYTHMLDEAQNLTADILVQIAFGEDWGSEDHRARKIITELGDLANICLTDPITATMKHFSIQPRMQELSKELHQILDDVVQRRLDVVAEQESRGDAKGGSENSADKGKEAKDILSLAINTMAKKNLDGEKRHGLSLLTDEDRVVVVHQLRTFYFAGHDTTATAISWAMWLLSQHDDVLEKLRKELVGHNIYVYDTSKASTNAASPLSVSSAPTYESIQNCEYLDAVVKEVLRLYPPANSARYTADMDNTTWNGYTLGGSPLYINSYVMHRLKQYWGDDAEIFRPERFVGVAPSTYMHKYIPFSKGKRDCLGKYFAILELKLAVASMAQRYDMECVDLDETIGLRQASYPLKGAKVRLTFRKQT